MFASSVMQKDNPNIYLLNLVKQEIQRALLPIRYGDSLSSTETIVASYLNVTNDITAGGDIVAGDDVIAVGDVSGTSLTINTSSLVVHATSKKTGVNSANPAGQLEVITSATGTIPLVVKGIVGQSSVLQAWYIGGSPIASLSQGGLFSTDSINVDSVTAVSISSTSYISATTYITAGSYINTDAYFNCSATNAYLSLGASIANTPYIALKSSQYGNTFDAKIAVTGGADGVTGQGVMALTASEVGTTYLNTSRLNVCGLAGVASTMTTPSAILAALTINPFDATANTPLQQWRSSLSAVVASVDSEGDIVSGNIISNSAANRDLGSSGNHWLNLYADNITGNLYSIGTASTSLIPSANNTYDLGSSEPKRWLTVYAGHINTTDITSDLTPDATANNRTLGSGSSYWASAYVNNLYASGTLNANTSLLAVGGSISARKVSSTGVDGTSAFTSSYTAPTHTPAISVHPYNATAGIVLQAWRDNDNNDVATITSSGVLGTDGAISAGGTLSAPNLSLVGTTDSVTSSLIGANGQTANLQNWYVYGAGSPSAYIGVNGTFAASSVVTTNVTISWTGADSYLNIGNNNDGASRTPFIDFHSSGYNNDYDSRIIAGGGTDTDGAGTLQVLASSLINSTFKNSGKMSVGKTTIDYGTLDVLSAATDWTVLYVRGASAQTAPLQEWYKDSTLKALMSEGGIFKCAINRQGGDTTAWDTYGTTNYVDTVAFWQCGSTYLSLVGEASKAVTITLPVAYSNVDQFLIYATIDSVVVSTKVFVAWGTHLGSASTFEVKVFTSDASVTTAGVLVQWMTVGK